jgi:nitrogen regulatory protein PII
MTISRISASVFRSLSKDITEALAGIGVTTLTSFAARSPTVEHGGFWGGTKIVDDPVDTFSFFVPSDVVDKVVSLLVTVGRLDLPGRGSVFAVNVELPHPDNAKHVNQVLVDGLETVQLSNNVTGVCCIVQRLV